MEHVFLWLPIKYTPLTGLYPRRTLAVYCGQGQVSLPEDHKTASAGQFLLCREAEDKPVRLESSQAAQLITAVIYSR